MNCGQVQELLPLHVGGDLKGKRAQLVSAHMESCSECDELADAYLSSRRLVQEFTPPAFDESLYSEMRQNVLRQIRQQPEPSARLSLGAWLIQPRFRWVAATALLLAVFGFVFYFASRRNETQNTLAGKANEADQSKTPFQISTLGDRVGLTLDARAGRPLISRSNSSAVKAQRTVHSVKFVRREVPEQTAMQSRKEPKLPLVMPAANLEKTVRLEMQTNDPNIRIIWFTHQSPENLPGESSKGF